VENNNKNNNNDLKKEKKKTNLEDKDTEYNELEERKNELKDRLKYGMRKKKKRKNSNENGDKDPKKDPKKKFNFKTVIMLLFVVIIIMLLPLMMDSVKMKDQKIISYTEFLKKANNGEFKVVQEKEGYVIGKQKLEDTVAVRARMISNRVS
jgi:cell division protease FtsH